MRFHSGISENESSRDAVDELIAGARDATGDRIDVAFVFFSAHHREEAEGIVERLWLELDPQALVGCSAEGVIGGDREVEREPGMSLLVAGAMPAGVRVHPFHIATNDWSQLITKDHDDNTLRERLGYSEETRAIIGFGDPFTTPITQFLNAMDRSCPRSPLVGGLASSARQPGENTLLRNDAAYDEGFVGVSLSGPIEIETVVSQGCRAIGRPVVITKAHNNVIEQLGGRPALKILHELIETLDARDQSLLEHGLLIGRAISEYRDTFGRGDFLIRSLTGADQESGQIALGDYVRVGQTVQFHVRDAATADEDLNSMLEGGASRSDVAGGLLFSCNGRGTRLFDEPCHDIAVAHRAMPKLPIAGFFAAGELGPVGGKNFIHGHTASFALFRGDRSSK